LTKKPSSNQLDAQLLKRVLAEAAPYKSLLLSTTLMAVLLAPLATIRPWLVQKMVDEHIVYSDVEGLLKLSVIFIIVLFLHAFLTYLFTYLSGVLGQAVVRDLRIKIFNHINTETERENFFNIFKRNLFLFFRLFYANKFCCV
jgi:ATP-binding cassette subfamily B protein